MTHRPSKEQLDTYRQRRETRKGHFGPGHLPQGTVVMAELPTATHYTLKEEKYPDEMYPRVMVRIERLERNGPDSWVAYGKGILDVAVNDGVAFTTEQHECFNINWIRAIVERGKGPMILRAPSHDISWWMRQSPLDKHSSKYCIDGLYRFISGLIIINPKLHFDHSTHLLDLEAMVEWLEQHPTMQAAVWQYGYRTFYVINKKKFIQLVKANLPRFFTQRRAAQVEQDHGFYDDNLIYEEAEFVDKDINEEQHEGSHYDY